MIVELEGKDSFFNEVLPGGLIAANMEISMPDTILDNMELIKFRNSPLVFDTNKKLSLQFK